MRLYLIRHADPDYENDTITPAGHLEAAALAKRMKSIGLDRIYASPLGRAKATAKYTADALDMHPTIEEWTCEVAGCHYNDTLGEKPLGKIAVWDTPGETIRAKSPWPTERTWEQIDPECAPLVREKFDTIRKCSDAFLSRHGYERQDGRFRIRAANRERIAIFCHNGTISFLLAQLLEIPLSLVWSGFWHAPTAVTTILFEERSNDWAIPRAISVADTSHLYAAGLQIRPRGISANWE
jgi:probable phosphoglycerate mutase